MGCTSTQNPPQEYPGSPLVAPENPDTSNSAIDLKAGCNSLKSQIEDYLGQGQACKVDSDCVMSDYLPCPFGCYAIVNKNMSGGILQQAIEEHRSRCGPQCEYSCIAPSENYICNEGICSEAAQTQ